MSAVVRAPGLRAARAVPSSLRASSSAHLFQAPAVRSMVLAVRRSVVVASAGGEDDTRGRRRPLRPSEREFIVEAPGRKSRPPPPDIPSAAPVMQSSTFNLTKGGEAAVVPSTPKGEDEEDEDEDEPANTLDWALKSMDKNLNAAEREPPVVAQKAWEVARGPVGQKVGKAASTGAKAAAQAGLTVGAEAVKRAAPIAGWAAKKTGGAALGVIGSGIKGAFGKDDKKKNKDKRKK